jgi:RNA polymerase sigma factor (sigma-70 family)
MPSTDAEFDELMREVLAGSEDAAEVLFRDYGPYLIQAIRRKLSKRIRSKFDSLDFAQDVWASFFTGEPKTFSTRAELVAFLTRVAENKVIDTTRRQLNTHKHDVRRERSLDDSTRFDKEDLHAEGPTPSQIMMSKEEWRIFLNKQPLIYRRVFVLLRDGVTQEQIAAKLGISKRTVQRVAQDYPVGAAHD